MSDTIELGQTTINRLEDAIERAFRKAGVPAEQVEVAMLGPQVIEDIRQVVADAIREQR